MKRSTKRRAATPTLTRIVDVLDQIIRILDNMKMRDDLLSFGQTQITTRLYRLEQQQERQQRTRKKAR